MRVMNLNDIDARLQCPLRRLYERLHNILDALLRELLRLREVGVERDRARANHIIGPAVCSFVGDEPTVNEGREGGRLATSVGELDADLLVLGMRKVDYLLVRGYKVICPYAGVLRRNPALRNHRGRFDEG